MGQKPHFHFSIWVASWPSTNYWTIHLFPYWSIMSLLHVVSFRSFVGLFLGCPFCSTGLFLSFCPNTTLIVLHASCAGTWPRSEAQEIIISYPSFWEFLVSPPEMYTSWLSLIQPLTLCPKRDNRIAVLNSGIRFVTSSFLMHMTPQLQTHNSTRQIFAETEWKCLERPNTPSRVCLWTSLPAAPEIALCLFIRHVFVQFLLRSW